MTNKTSIEWTEKTWNPTSGCSKVSSGCKHCYAERLWPRLSAPGQPYAGRQFTDLAFHPERLAQVAKLRKPSMVFVNSMSDLFHPAVTDVQIGEVLDVIEATPRHSYQILTKRPERLACFNPYPPNAWVGVSIEDQEAADLRVPLLLNAVAKVRFLSCEPLLGPVALDNWLRLLDQVIVGGESGPRARFMNPDWAESIMAQCRAAHVAFFMKQMARKAPIPERLFIREYPGERGTA